jgi:hypothetical protein
MTAIQICALIGLIIGAALLYWTGYRGGLINGRIEGIDEGKAIQQSDNSEAIRSLERETLLAIAEKLRVAAETFSAFRTGKKLERDSLALRDQALYMAALLEPSAQEEAA